MKTETKQVLVAVPVAIVSTALILACIAGCLMMFTGCTTIDGKKQVSPVVVQITESVVCAGATFTVSEKPGLRPTLVDARNYLTLAIAQTNLSKVDFSVILHSLGNGTWITPAASLFYSWSGDPVSARLILTALRNGLACAGEGSFMPAASRAKAIALPRPDRVCVYTDKDKGSSWFCIAANGHIVTTWATKVDGRPVQKFSRWYSSAKRAAIRENPTLEVIEYR